MTQVPIDLVVIGTRLRGVDQQHVAALAESIAEVGLLSPITVVSEKVMQQHVSVDGWRVIAGVHRLEACRSLGLVDIPVNVVELSELHRQIAECDENLCGTKLTPAERAMFTAQRKRAYEALHPETKNGGDRRSSDRQFGELKGDRFTIDTSKRTGHSERSVQRDAGRGERISPDVIEAIRGTELDTGQTLDRLARLPRDLQMSAAKDMRVPPAPGPRHDSDVEEAQLAKLMNAWNAAGKTVRERFLDIVQSPVFDATRAA